MGRKRLTEFAAKNLLYKTFQIEYKGFSYNTSDNIDVLLQNLSSETLYVVKVDQGVKGRFKKGLVALDQKNSQISDTIKNISQKGYSQFIIEPILSHSAEEEYYIALERTREGIYIYYSQQGGVDIESHKEEVYKILFSNTEDLAKIADALSWKKEEIQKLIDLFQQSYISFLEINPFVLRNGNPHFLDIACEVDSAAEFFVENSWTKNDFARELSLSETEEEKSIRLLASQSQASFKFDVLNQDGSIFVLLSGGGASVVVADEIYNQGYHKELANYGEYSGNPNTEETYLYTKSVLQFLLHSKSNKKVLIIGGGVANFTDIRLTFKGVIQALKEKAPELRDQQVRIFVRRGGPNQKEGLALMTEFLKKEELYGDVKGPEMVLTDIVLSAIQYLKK